MPKQIIKTIKGLFKPKTQPPKTIQIPPQIEVTPQIEKEWLLMQDRVTNFRKDLILAEQKRVQELNSVCPKCGSTKIESLKKSLKDLIGSLLDYLVHERCYQINGEEDIPLCRCECGYEWCKTFEGKVYEETSWGQFIKELENKKEGKILKNEIVAGISITTIHYIFQYYGHVGLNNFDWTTPEERRCYTILGMNYKPINAIPYGEEYYYDEFKFDPEYLKSLGAVG